VKSARLSTGVSLPYVEQGDPSGVPVLLLHGVTDSWRSFEPILPHLPRSIHAIALTQRGHGDADRPGDGYRTRDFAADAAAFTASLGLGPAIVVGHSMGSVNALRLAIDHPQAVLGLVLAGSSPSFRDDPAVAEFWDVEVSRLADPVDPALAREFQLSTFARPAPEAFLETVVQESLKVPARVWRASFEGFLEYDLTAELGRIGVPALVLWGDQDVFCSRADQEALVGGIPDSRLVVYEGTGHALHWEEPERFAADVVTFVAGLGGRPATT
jgi:pimeloyl-ACP methyl ester carboxylesterase